jgi:GT2 family glycosyltransferase
VVDLSVIIVNWNTRELLQHCLQSVRDTAVGLSLELLVVDNASVDGSVAMVRENFPFVHVIANTENRGFARANNQAIERAQGRHLLLLNSDTEVRPGALRILWEFMEGHPQAGAAGARLLNADGTLQPSCHPMLTPGLEFWRLLFLDRIWPRATYPMRAWDLTTPRRVQVIKGACLMLRREALDQVGVLDQQYFMYSEEMDLCYRLDSGGWSLHWVPQARVVHHGESSTRQVAEEMYIELYRSKVQFFRKFGGEGQARRFKVILVLAYLPRLLVATAAAPFARGTATRSRASRRLLASLSGM